MAKTEAILSILFTASGALINIVTVSNRRFELPQFSDLLSWVSPTDGKVCPTGEEKPISFTMIL